MKNFKNMFLAFFVSTLTALNLVLPAYAEETDTQTVNTAGFSVSVVGDGTVTVTDDSDTHSLSQGDTYNADYEENTKIKISSKSSDSTMIQDVTLNDTTIDGFKSGKSSFEFVYTTKTADVNFVVTFGQKEEKTKNASSNDEQSKSESKEESTKSDDSSTDENKSEDLQTYEAEKSQNKERYGSIDVNLNDLDIDTSKTVYTKYLYAIPSAVSENDTITSALIDKDSKNTIYTQMQEASTVYTDGKDYYILADTPFENGLALKSYPYDYDVARGNDNGTTVSDGVTYDKKKHILKIDGDVFKDVSKQQKEENSESSDFSDLQVQFLVPADVENDVKVKTTVVNKQNLIDSVVDSTISLRPFMTARFQLASKETAKNIKPKNVKVYVNDSEEPLESKYGAYDPDTGYMALSYRGADLKSLKIVVSNSVSRAAGIGMGTAKVGDLNVLAYLAKGTKDVFRVGSAIDVVGKFGNDSYIQKLDGPKTLYNKSRHGYPNFDTIDWNATGNNGESGYSESALGIPMSITMNGETVDFTLRDANGNSYGQWVNGGQFLEGAGITDPVKFNGGIQAFCHHVSASLNIGTVDENSASALRYPNCTLRVLDASTISGYRHVVFGFETNKYHFSGTSPQTVGMVFELAFQVNVEGKLQIHKSSGNTAITDNNSCYSLKDAVYGIYKSESDAKNNTNRVTTLTTDENGWTSATTLNAGDYYIKELTAPKGYALNGTVGKITVTSGNTATYSTTDIPQSDPVGILLGKVDRETNKNKPQGSASLAGAEFTVKYYKGFYDSDPASAGQTPVRQWVLKTDSDGFTVLSSSYKVSGNDFYYASNGDTTLPVGTITIQETKAPTGYFINNEVFVRKITSDGNTEHVETYNEPIVKEQVIKLHLTKTQYNSDVKINGAVFRHTKPNGTTEDLTTQNGEITITGLEPGTHRIKEVSVGDGYLVSDKECVFDVASGTGKITFQSTSSDKNAFSFAINDNDAYVSYGDKVTDFTLRVHKTNQFGKVLKGAEFTLYSDAECKNVVDKQISNDDGIMNFKNLKDRTHYYLVETKAPQGYRIPVDANGKPYVHDIYTESTPQNNTFDFTVDAIKYGTDKTTGNVRLEGTKASRIVTVDITNKTGQLLPETGSNGTLVLMVVGCALVGMAIYESKKHKKEQKQ